MNKYTVKVEDAQQHAALMNFLDNQGIVWIDGDKPKTAPFLKSHPNIVFKSNNKVSRERDAYIADSEVGPILSFKAFAAIQSIELGPEPMSVVLTKDYSAVIDYTAETVTVGCQVIPFTKINEVHACTKKHEASTVMSEAVPQSECDAALRNAVHYAMPNGATKAQKQEVVDYLTKYGFKVVKA